MRGVKDATNDLDVLDRTVYAGDNIAVACGEVSGIVVVDIDDDEAWKWFLEKNGGEPETLMQMTSKGRHVFFNYPGFKIKNSVGKIHPKIDIRSDNGYVLLQPSTHVTGIQYEFFDFFADVNDMPQWLYGILEKSQTPEVINRGSSAESDAEINDALAHIDPDCSYESWINVGMALHSEGYGLELWDAWSSQGDKYKGQHDLALHWDSFTVGGGVGIGTLWQMAEANGFERHIDMSRIKAFIEGDFAETHCISSMDMEKPEFPFNAYDLPGIIGETTRWITHVNNFYQPEIALCGVVATLGAVFGRRYEDARSNRTNVYFTVLADTGAGKGAAQKCLSRLLKAAGLEQYLGSNDFVSERGLQRSLSEQPSQVMMLDEIGKKLSSAKFSTGSGRSRIMELLTELYSASDTTIDSGRQVSQSAEPIVMVEPNLCIFGMSPLSEYVKILDKGAIKSGEWNRFFIISGRERKSATRNPDPWPSTPPEGIVARWSEFAPPKAEGYYTDLPQEGMARAPVIRVDTSDVNDVLKALNTQEDAMYERFLDEEQLHGLWARLAQNAMKVAMIFAIARNPEAPHMTERDVEYGWQLAEYAINYSIWIGKYHLAESEYERKVNRVVDMILNAGPDGITANQINRSSRHITPTDRDRILDDLETRQERIFSEIKGRTKVYKARVH